MPASINPAGYCESEGCKYPKETGRDYCTRCIRLARAVARRLDDPRDVLAGLDFVPDVSALPRFVEVLSGDRSQLSFRMLRGEGFREEDVRLVVELLRARYP